VLLTQAAVTYANRKYNLDTTQTVTALVTEADQAGLVRWEEFLVAGIDERKLDRQPPAGRFRELPAVFSNERTLNSMKNDFADWIYREKDVIVRANEELGVFAGPGISDEDFLEQCLEAAQAREDVELEKLEAQYRKKLDAVQNRLEKEQSELRADEAELSRRKQAEYTSYAETVFSLFKGRRKSLSSSLSRRNMTAKAQEEVEESQEQISALSSEMEELKGELERQIDALDDLWAAVAEHTSEISVAAAKKNIVVDLFGVAWFPHYYLQVGQETYELPAFAAES
jgi:hypothetical protein